MAPFAPIIVADVGNSRIKVARTTGSGSIEGAWAFDAEQVRQHEHDLRTRGYLSPEACWYIASVNKPASDMLYEKLQFWGLRSLRCFHAAEDLPLRPEWAPAGAGVDRVLAVLAAVMLLSSRSCIVVCCGTAITIDAIDARGRWLGGAVAPGVGLMGRALNAGTAQLPFVGPTDDFSCAIGRDTHSAISAGLAGFVAGGLQRLIALQRAALCVDATILWTGGDAMTLGKAVEGPGARVIADLVLRGLTLQTAASEVVPSP